MMPRLITRMMGLVGAALLGSVAAGAEEAAPAPHLAHESYVEDVLRKPSLPLDDPLAMFASVLDALPEQVKVYPTENYYYFKLVHAGVTYAGNIRLDVQDRDQGKVHFAYYPDLSAWHDDEPVTYVVLDSTQGVAVEKLDRLRYRISFRGKSVAFALNDLSAIAPPAGMLTPDETYLGPIFDDSAVRFFLVYDRRLKIFHYLLDETVPATDQYFPATATDHIVIGKRTGFAFYLDRRRNRKILIGVFTDNARTNTYFDGPFDQMPDNFIVGDALRDAILDANPKLKGKIDRLGYSPGGEQRFAITPYRYYREQDELLAFDRCASSPRLPPELYQACFVVDHESGDDRPEALKRLPTKPSAQRARRRG